MVMRKTIEALVQSFADNLASQGMAIRRGDSKTGNKYARRYTASFEQLRALGDRGRDALVPLLQHPSADVRVTTAAVLLRYRTADAMAVLEAEAKGQGLAAFEAEQALERWRDGTWALDPPD
jgi:hypothetical protein